MHQADPIQYWQVPHLAALDYDALLDLFKSLDSPAPGEVSGEYAGIDYLGQTEETFEAALGRVKAGNGVFWLGKGFPGEEGDGASGYNRLRQPDGTVARCDRFGVHRGTSPIDGKETLMLKYSDYDNGAGSIGFLDEIRKVNDRLFLCTGTPEEGTAKPGFFFLAGPPAPFRGVDDPQSELLHAGAEA
ncbi:hypothetical protein [Arthrobacter crystallopoietes]|uniref:Uncharacterized protein n=1 Tax=Crystallibacter crystallopoietes TaxID=37928 RepID=A0A1H1BY36_9MICC|nr:hypothetical protein [Arthrobacter crystallopoietes]AUI50969.1 hypothetical protein AC20117_09215 [Arthrobacter crystallopoietes]SDQ56690.1 hypothetical protein SAMN04489742_1628 [Arthrobacter crystallopoietes]